MADIADGHIDSKGGAYWQDLTRGATSRYKEAVMERLVRQHFNRPCESLIDIGCGTCETILKYRGILGASRVTCTDYDAGIVEQMRSLHRGEEIEWIVADIFALADLRDSFDLVFLMDMIHEVYSFYGRPGRAAETPIDHKLGLEFVERALAQVASIVRPGGGILLTDDVLSEEQGPVTIRFRHSAAADAVRYFLSNYPSRRIGTTLQGDLMTIQCRDLNVLLTQYNKIKNADWSRWNIERLEVHEYMSESEYRTLFERLGFTMHAVVGTPESARQEWESDFEVISGLPSLPEKRITLLAVKG